MSGLVKGLIWVVCCAISLFVAAIPEVAMYFIWGIVAPSTEFGRLFMMAVFVLGGGGLCVLFAFLGFALWTAATGAILEA